jgi:hypothetical protein
MKLLQRSSGVGESSLLFDNLVVITSILIFSQLKTGRELWGRPLEQSGSRPELGESLSRLVSQPRRSKAVADKLKIN